MAAWTYPPLPPDLEAQAHRSPNGEYAWRWRDIGLVFDALAELGYAICFGELWIILPDGRMGGLIPQAGGGPAGVYPWQTEWHRRAGESWPAFSARLHDEARAALARYHPEDDVPPELRPHIWVNVWFTDVDQD